MKPSTSLKIQYVSDLHLEFPQNRAWLEEHPLEVTGDILLVAGDTAYLDTPKSGQDTYSRYSFWDWAAEHYKQVIVCFGNHDFYGYYDLATMPDGYCKEIRPNIHAYYNAFFVSIVRTFVIMPPIVTTLLLFSGVIKSYGCVCSSK